MKFPHYVPFFYSMYSTILLRPAISREIQRCVPPLSCLKLTCMSWDSTSRIMLDRLMHCLLGTRTRDRDYTSHWSCRGPPTKLCSSSDAPTGPTRQFLPSTSSSSQSWAGRGGSPPLLRGGWRV